MTNLQDKTGRLGRLRPIHVRDVVETARMERVHRTTRRTTADRMDAWSIRHRMPPAPHTIRRWRHRWFVYGVVSTLATLAVSYAVFAALFVWILGGGS